MATKGRIAFIVALSWSICGQTSSVKNEALVKAVFGLDVTISNYTRVITKCPRASCSMTCLTTPGCHSLGYQAATATCWLYHHLVEFSTVGVSAPGTQYSWLLSPRCPAELGFSLEQGLCYLYIDSRISLNNANLLCRELGATLFIADTPQKVAFLGSKITSSAWVCASDAMAEGVQTINKRLRETSVVGLFLQLVLSILMSLDSWYWCDGTFLPLDSALWGPGQPNDGDGSQDALVVNTAGELNDALHLTGLNHVTCQIHLY